MEESTKKIVMELLESELRAAEKCISITNAAIRAAEADENDSVIKTQIRTKRNVLQRAELLQNAIKDLSGAAPQSNPAPAQKGKNISCKSC